MIFVYNRLLKIVGPSKFKITTMAIVYIQAMKQYGVFLGITISIRGLKDNTLPHLYKIYRELAITYCVLFTFTSYFIFFVLREDRPRWSTKG